MRLVWPLRWLLVLVALLLVFEFWGMLVVDKARTTPATLILVNGIASSFDESPPTLEARADGGRLGFMLPPNTKYVATEYARSTRYVTTYGHTAADLAEYFVTWVPNAGWELADNTQDRALVFHRSGMVVGTTELLRIEFARFLGPFWMIAVDVTVKPS